MGDVAVRASGLSKVYRLYDRPIHRLYEKLLPGGRRHREVWALRDVDFEVARGSALGLVGSNGAGKSTLLKVLSGTTLPTAGRFEVEGRVSSLLELGTGFYPGFTGLQNIHLAGVVMGFSRREIERKVPEIVEFSELGGFIHQPIRTYSSGMIMRLGFAVATAVDPDVLIIDEILAVGDLHFQKRCIDRIMSFRAAGKTILFCSHSMYHVEEICDHALWVQEGRVRMHERSRVVCRTYERFERGRRSHHEGRGGDDLFEPPRDPQLAIRDPAEGDRLPLDDGDDALGFVGDLPRIRNVRLLDAAEQPATVVDPATGERVPGASVLDDLAVEIDYDLPRDVEGVVIGTAIYRGDQEMMAGIGSHMSGFDPPRRRGHYTVRLDLPQIRLLHGGYRLVAYVADERGLHVYHSLSLAGGFLLLQKGRFLGALLLEHQWSARRRLPRPEAEAEPAAGGVEPPREDWAGVRPEPGPGVAHDGG